MPSIEKEIRSFIVEHFLLGNEASLKNNDSFLEKGTFDSTGILELVSFLERTYHIQLEPEELVPENLDSVDCLTQFLQKKMGTAAAVPQGR